MCMCIVHVYWSKFNSYGEHYATLLYRVLVFHFFFCLSLFVSFSYQLEQGESKRKALPSWLREELEKMERKKRKEMEKEALEKARLEGEREQRAAWRDELDSGDEEEDRRRERSSSRRREDREAERERERERGRGHSDRESRHRNIRPHHSSKSRSRSPYRVGHCTCTYNVLIKFSDPLLSKNFSTLQYFRLAVSLHPLQRGTERNHQKRMKRISKLLWCVWFQIKHTYHFFTYSDLH